MGRRYSSRELYELRNNIPIDDLIKNKLSIPSKISEGYFRFLCPVCNEFQTSTNPKTNLARCFRCERNFNTIDMMMICSNTKFVESVEMLINIRNNLSKQRNICHRAEKYRSVGNPESIGMILDNPGVKER
jgi:DNA primase